MAANSRAFAALASAIKTDGRLVGSELLELLRTYRPLSTQTTRPVLDLDTPYNDALGETRFAILQWKLRPLPSVKKVVEEFRDLQIKRISRAHGYSTERAAMEAEDLSPYKKEHIFYCLETTL